MTLAQFIKTARTRRGLTQEALAVKVHVSLKTIQSWEQGWRLPHVIYVLRLCHALNLSTEKLLLRVWYCRSRKRTANLNND